MLIVNTNSGGHAVIGFYFAKQLLGNGHEVTIMTVGEEASDKMKKPPFNRFSVKLENKFQLFMLKVDYVQQFCHLIMGNKFSGNCGGWWEDSMGQASRRG